MKMKENGSASIKIRSADNLEGAASDTIFIQHLKNISKTINERILSDQELAAVFFELQQLVNRVSNENKRRRGIKKSTPRYGFEEFRTPTENALKTFCDCFYDCSMRRPKLQATLDNLHFVYTEGAELQISLNAFMDEVIDKLRPKFISCNNGVYEFNDPEHQRLAMREK